MISLIVKSRIDCNEYNKASVLEMIADANLANKTLHKTHTHSHKDKLHIMTLIQAPKGQQLWPHCQQHEEDTVPSFTSLTIRPPASCLEKVPPMRCLFLTNNQKGLVPIKKPEHVEGPACCTQGCQRKGKFLFAPQTQSRGQQEAAFFAFAPCICFWLFCFGS